ncbi:TRAP transporter small permease [uncultured Sneathiella sp.]|jgi:TRAP-type C4-dicarboxylate transport system permease small subunit|uniref:TRAP transporter small permease n=1 Tax=uncultured Sneathiella sp. TaxID=879315 RepID=UPI0030D9F720|tara:strand:- start:469 stop:999 length:531 start_codon:yes stop_codon:yes gene_type:complete
MMEKIDRLISLVERAVLTLSCVCLFGIMIIVTVDVILRYLFSSPLSWSYDLISMYLATLLFFAAVSDSFRRGSHVRIELFNKFGSTRVRAAFEVIGFISALVMFYVMFEVSLEDAVKSLFGGDVISGAIAWPTWIPYMMASCGFGLLAIRIVFTIAERIQVIVTGQPIFRSVENLE